MNKVRSMSFMWPILMLDVYKQIVKKDCTFAKDGKTVNIS